MLQRWIPERITTTPHCTRSVSFPPTMKKASKGLCLHVRRISICESLPPLEKQLYRGVRGMRQGLRHQLLRFTAGARCLSRFESLQGSDSDSWWPSHLDRIFSILEAQDFSRPRDQSRLSQPRPLRCAVELCEMLWEDAALLKVNRRRDGCGGLPTMLAYRACRARCK